MQATNFTLEAIFYLTARTALITNLISFEQFAFQIDFRQISSLLWKTK